MNKLTYDDKRAILQEHVNIPLIHETGETPDTSVEKVVMIRVGNQSITLTVESVSAKSGANQAQTTEAEICIIELNLPSTGGTIFPTDTGVVSANLDRSAGRDLIGLEVLQDVAYDETGATRLMLEGVTANNRVRTKVPVTGVSYSLDKNTDYLLRSLIVAGDTGNSTSYITMDLALISEDE